MSEATEQAGGNPGDAGAVAPPADAGSFLANVAAQTPEGAAGTPNEAAGGDTPALDTADSAIQETLDGPPEGIPEKFYDRETKQVRVDEMAKGYNSLEKLLSREKLPLPTGDDDEEGWERVNAAFRPESPEAYDFGDPPEMPEGMPYDEDAVESFRNLAYANGIPPRTAKAIFDTEVKSRLEQHAQWQKLQQEQRTKLDHDLRREYGAQYPAVEQRAANIMSKYADPDFVQFLNESNQGNDPRMIRFLDKIGRDMGGETKLVGNAQAQPAPADLDATIAKFNQKHEKVLFDKSHPDHARLVAERDKLFKARYPEPAA